jgi:putative transposase
VAFAGERLTLSVLSILCLSCDTEQERDENATKNIEMVVMGHRHDFKRTGSDCKTVSAASYPELSRITDLLGR